MFFHKLKRPSFKEASFAFGACGLRNDAICGFCCMLPRWQSKSACLRKIPIEDNCS